MAEAGRIAFLQYKARQLPTASPDAVQRILGDLNKGSRDADREVAREAHRLLQEYLNRTHEQGS